jgi:hypothetical protein
MNIRSTDNVYFFDSETDIRGSRPYASISEEELTRLIQRFVSWAAILATHPKLAESFGDASTAHIMLATDLRMAVKKSRQENVYPNVVLITQKFEAAMKLMTISRAMEPEFAGLIAGENQRWEEDCYPLFKQ